MKTNQVRGLQPNFQQQQQQQQPQLNIIARIPHQGMNPSFPSVNNQGVTGQRMPFGSQSQNQQANQMIVNQSGPSPGGSGNASGMVVPNSGLSPFGCANSSGMTPPNSNTPAAVVAQQNAAAQMLSNRPIMSPSNDFNPNMIQMKNQQQQSMNSQAPSPFSQNQNVFNNNLMMQNNQRMMPPTPTGDLIPVPSPSPSLNSNGPPPPVSTPNTPNVASLFNRPEPTPPPSLPIPSPQQSSGKGQNFGGNMSNSNASMNAMMNNRNSLSSQRAALEAACKEEDSPPPTHSPQNNNRGKLDQKLDSKMEMDDDKSELGDVKIKTEDSDDHKMGSKSWIEAGDIKKEKIDDIDMNTNASGAEGGWDNIKREIKMETDDVKPKIKEEAMSPASTSDSQALVKPELKLEPVPSNVADKKKKCSKFFTNNFQNLNFF